MPIITCDIRQGRTKEQKHELAMELTKAVQQVTGVSIDHTERSWLVAQIMQDPAKHRVLENVGEVTGVKFVLIVHGSIGAPGFCHSTLEHSWRLVAHRGHSGSVETTRTSAGLGAITKR